MTPLNNEKLLEFALPTLAFALALLVWESWVWAAAVPSYILPAPSLVLATLVKDWGTLSGSFLVTLRRTFEALASAVVGGVALAVLFAQSRIIARAFFPFAIILQVTPVVAIAPLLVIVMPANSAVFIIAFLVAFFPILSNTALGLASADHNLMDLFQLYGASRWRQLLWLRLPSALPYFLGGLRIGGGLSLIGAIVAELVAGSAGKSSGLAFRIVESMFLLNMPRTFAVLALISAAGITIYLSLAAFSHLLLRRWHDSARGREL